MPGADHNDNLDDLDLGETQRAQDGTGRDAGDTLDSAPTLRGETVLAGRYRIVRELGRGAMGTVYLATDRKLDDRPVAVKMPAAVLARNPRAVRNLKQEALLAMQLSHPHIVTLRSFEETADGVFLVMDYVDGRTLEEVLSERGTLPEEEVLRLFRPVAEAIDFAHSKKVIHRDIKPSNILIAADGTPLVTDFGIAREMRDSYTRTTGKVTGGTLPYMSPEQLRGDAPAPAQDVYSLAAAMYECLTGNPPFYRGELPHQIEHVPAARPERGGPIVDAVMAGLAKDPRKRPATCAGLLPVAAAPMQMPSKGLAREAPKITEERRYGAMAAGISLAAFAVIGIVLYLALSTPTSGPVTPSEKRTPDAMAPAAPAPPAPSPVPVSPASPAPVASPQHGRTAAEVIFGGAAPVQPPPSPAPVASPAQGRTAAEELFGPAVAAQPSPPPVPSVPKAETVQQVDPLVEEYKKADAALGEEEKKPLGERDYKSMAAAFEDIAKKTDKTYLKQAARERVALIAAMADQQKEYLRIQGIGDRLDKRLTDLKKQPDSNLAPMKGTPPVAAPPKKTKATVTVTPQLAERQRIFADVQEMMSQAEKLMARAQRPEDYNEALRALAQAERSIDVAQVLSAEEKQRLREEVYGLRRQMQTRLSEVVGEPPKEISLDLGGGVTMKCVLIPAGRFVMGSPSSEGNRDEYETQHAVTITKPFYMGIHEVAVGQFAAFVNETRYQTEAEIDGWAFAWTGTSLEKVNGASWRNPGFPQGETHPVTEVSWNDAVAFCQWLSRKSGRTVRLPTEAEWEYACRAGTTTAYQWGDNPDSGKGWANGPDQTGKTRFPSSPAFNWADGYVFTSPAGSFRANAWGLFDMHGNVLEWCVDWYDRGYYGIGANVDPSGLATGAFRVLRGGSWGGNPSDCRSAIRFRVPPVNKFNILGLRCALDFK
jgi:formylglycine-generating enzyme required for sulfatase activity/serine/threonine protein kinase